MLARLGGPAVHWDRNVGGVLYGSLGKATHTIGLGSRLAGSLKSPLQERLQPPTPPICGILARRSHFESIFTRRSCSYLMPTYLTPDAFFREWLYALTRAVSRAVGIVHSPPLDSLDSLLKLAEVCHSVDERTLPASYKTKMGER